MNLGSDLSQDLFERSFGGKYESIQERMACAFLIRAFAGKSNIKSKSPSRYPSGYLVMGSLLL